MTLATPMDDQEYLRVVGTYKHGSICRVKLVNFLTYNDVEVRPGPRLNMVIGPNGTGKSTILCAICLGLGGEPKLLGRASDIETFVANGYDEGTIEIEVVNTNEGEPNPVIVRRLKREGSPKSSFLWNGNPITGKAVRETCLREFNISVDNLCTFLPQDRVGSFSGFDSKQLLLETEKSLSSSQSLYHTHMELIRDQEEMRGGDNRKASLEERYEQLEMEHRRLERAKVLMEERSLAESQAELLRKKLLWLEFDEMIENVAEKREAKKALKNQLKERSKDLAPLEVAAREAREQAEHWTSDTNKHGENVRTHQREMEKQSRKYESHDDKIENIIQELVALDAHREVKKKKVADFRVKVEEFREVLKEYPPMETLDEEFQQSAKDQKATLPRYDAAKKELSNLEEQLRETDDDFRRAEERLGKMQDEKARRRERIYRQQPNLQKIADWLQNNRSKFRKEVMGPVMCEITSRSQLTAAYLEQHVANATLKSFIVQCKEDYDLLYKSVREGLGVPINISLIDRVRPIQRMYSESKMSTLKKEHGVIGYLDETFTAPDLIVQALRNSSSIDKVLVGTEQTQTSLDSRDLLKYLSQPEDGSRQLKSSCIFSSDGVKSYKYTSSISKYSGKPSVRVDDIKPAKFLASGVSDEAKDQAQADFDSIKQKRGEIQPRIVSAKTTVHEIQQEAQQTREKMKAARENIKKLERQRMKLTNAERKLKEAEADLSVDDQQEKDKKIQSLNSRIHHSMQALEAHGNAYKKMMEATILHSGSRLNKEAAAVEARRAEMLHQEGSRELEKLTEEFTRAGEDFKQAKILAHELKRKADDQAPIEDENKIPTPLKAQLDSLPVTCREDAVVALEEAENKLNSIVADNNAIRAFQTNQSEMTDVKAQLDDLNDAEARRKNELDQKVKPWEKKLSEAVVKVDALFTRYMGEMGCTGEVHLTKGQPTDDNPYGLFKEWGIEIRVSFRESIKLQVLSARVQSGGERSVSTIMYLMALQGMMVSPFRCVDEINQGLDERNERLVFRRIVENSTKVPGREGPTDHEGQYFLITPKLLPNLYDMEVEAMTVLVIFNGPFSMKDPRDWDISRILSLRKRAIEDTEAADDEENSPNGQSSSSKSTPSKRQRRALATREPTEVSA